MSEIIHAHVVTLVGKCKPQKEPRGDALRVLAHVCERLVSSVESKFADSPSHRARCLVSQSATQVKALQPLFACTTTHQYSADKMAALSDVVTKIKSSQSSVRDDWALYRAIGLLNAGKAFIACATKLVDAAGWSNAFLAQVGFCVDGMRKRCAWMIAIVGHRSPRGPRILASWSGFTFCRYLILVCFKGVP